MTLPEGTLPENGMSEEFEEAQQSLTPYSPKIVVEFFADGYRVSGSFDASKLPLADTLIDPSTKYLQVDDAYLSPITEPTVISSYYKQALIHKLQIDFVLTNRARDGMRRDEHYLRVRGITVSLTVPFFEITGELRTPMTIFNARRFLSTSSGYAITLLNVTARCTFNPKVIYQGGAAQINRERITFFGEKNG